MKSQKTLEKELIRIRIEEWENFTSEVIEVRYNDSWIPILGSNKGCSTLSYWRGKNRSAKALNFLKSKKKKIYYQLDDDDFLLKLDYCLEESNVLHIRYQLSNNQVLELSKLGVNYAVLLDMSPDFVWVPHLRPKEGYVMADHVFRSPVIIYKKGDIALAFIPDLKTLRNNRPYQTFMNFDMKSDIDDHPQIFYGFGNYEPIEHTFFKHEDTHLWEIPKDTDLTFRFYIIIFKDKSRLEILQSINRFFWEKYMRRNLYESLEPQVVSYNSNVYEGFKAIFDRHKFWGNFVINNQECGGIWQRSWAGTKKKEITFIPPEKLSLHRKRNSTETVSSNVGVNKQLNDMIFDPEKVIWFDKYTQRHAFSPRTAEVWNNAWFLNTRTAYGLKYFEKEMEEFSLEEKTDRILNTTLNLPRKSGIFPSVIFPAGLNSDIISYINGVKAGLYSNEYNVVDACLTMYWALKLRKQLEKNDETVEKSKELLELIKKLERENGAIPSFIALKNEKIGINNILLNSASSGAVLMFLTELYKVDPNSELLVLAKRIGKFIQNEILPNNKWHDFEPFFSCTMLPLDFFDNYTSSHVMNTLCIYWCAEGFKELAKITKEREYLRYGEQALAVLSLFQQVWDMPYISYNTFGGFGAQNADVELGDARQALFVRTYMEYYLQTDNEEYMERGIAALRASWALQLLKEYEKVSPGNIKDIRTIDSVDRGAMYENYGHTGSDFRVPGQITFDWGVGTATMATAYTKKYFGDLFIDFRREFVFGIDGILIKQFEFEKNTVKIALELIPGKKEVIIKTREPPQDPVEIIINERSIGKYKWDLFKSSSIIEI
jgi:hypothetical protein